MEMEYCAYQKTKGLGTRLFDQMMSRVGGVSVARTMCVESEVSFSNNALFVAGNTVNRWDKKLENIRCYVIKA